MPFFFCCFIAIFSVVLFSLYRLHLHDATHICWLYCTVAVADLALSRLFCIAPSVFVKHFNHFKQLSNITATFRTDLDQMILCSLLCVQLRVLRETRGLLQPCPIYTKWWLAINVPSPGHSSQVFCKHLNSVHQIHILER